MDRLILLTFIFIFQTAGNAQIGYINSNSIKYIYWGDVDSVIETHYEKYAKWNTIDKENPKEYTYNGHSHTFYKSLDRKIIKVDDNVYMSKDRYETRTIVFNHDKLLTEVQITNSKYEPDASYCYQYDEMKRITLITRLGALAVRRLSKYSKRDSIILDTMLFATYYNDGALNTLVSRSNHYKSVQVFSSQRKQDSIHYYETSELSEIDEKDRLREIKEQGYSKVFVKERSPSCIAYYDPKKNSYLVKAKSYNSYYKNGVRIWKFHNHNKTKTYLIPEGESVDIWKYNSSGHDSIKTNEKGDIIQIMKAFTNTGKMSVVIEFEIFYSKG